MDNSNYYVFAFATFGHPNDFRQSPFAYNKAEIAKKIKLFDLSNAIKVFPNTTIYSIRKEKINNSILIAYTIYSFAQEQKSKRDGTFIGSSIIFENYLCDENSIINYLNKFHNQLIDNNLENNTLKVNHSQDFTTDKLVFNFNSINESEKILRELNFSNSLNKSVVVYCKTNINSLVNFLRDSIDLLNVYDTIYFTESEEVARYVIQKGLFKLIQDVGDKREFERELNDLIEERKRKRELSISEFTREVQRINEDRKRSIQDYKNQLEQSERTHLDNERKLNESKNDINKIEQFYDDLLNKTNNLINQLRHNNGKIEEIKLIHNSNKILFNNGITDFKKPIYITTVAKPKPKGNLQTENPEFFTKTKNRETETKNKKEIESTSNKQWNQINFYKAATFVLVFILLSTWVYIWFFDSKPDEKIELNQNNEDSNLSDQKMPLINLTKPDELDPKHNSILNNNDFRIVANKISYNSKVEDIVKMIFSLNPTDINSSYSNQEKIYSEHLVFLNKQCFEEKDGNYYFVKDTIRKIPSFKKSF